MVEPPTPDQQQAPPDPVMANPVPIEVDRAVLRQAIKSRGEQCAAAQDAQSANVWADAVQKLAMALQYIDPSLHPQKTADGGSKPQGGSGKAKTDRPKAKST